MFVEQLDKKDIAEIINKIKEIINHEGNTNERDIDMETTKHCDGNNYVFVKAKGFMKCWISDFTFGTKIFDASSIYRKYMGEKFQQKYIDSYREYLTNKSNEKIETEMKHFESTLDL